MLAKQSITICSHRQNRMARSSVRGAYHRCNPFAIAPGRSHSGRNGYVPHSQADLDCRFGIGRPGTILVAWLLKQGHTLDEALKMPWHTPAEPKSRRQWEFLNAYSLSMGLLRRQKGGKKSRNTICNSLDIKKTAIL